MSLKAARVEQGFTLTELAIVIALIAVFTSLAVNRLDSIFGWQRDAALRRLINSWELVFRQSRLKGESYIFFFNLDAREYFVRRLVRTNVGESATGENSLQDFTSRGERRRQLEKQLSQVLSADEEAEIESKRERLPLQQLFFENQLTDVSSESRLAISPEFGEGPVVLPDGLEISDIEMGRERVQSGIVRFIVTPRGGDSAIFHISEGDNVLLLTVDPTIGRTELNSAH